jgi:transcriptional regulator with XRE-family HTH domain
VGTAGGPDAPGEQPGGPVGSAVGQAVGDIGAYIRAQREHARVSLRQLARTAGVSNPYLSQIERGLREPSDTVVEAIAGALDLTTERLYDAAGIQVQDGGIEEAGAVREAILADPDLKPAQRRALLETYAAFLIANGGPRRRAAGSSRTRSAPPAGS